MPSKIYLSLPLLSTAPPSLLGSRVHLPAIAPAWSPLPGGALLEGEGKKEKEGESRTPWMSAEPRVRWMAAKLPFRVSWEGHHHPLYVICMYPTRRWMALGLQAGGRQGSPQMPRIRPFVPAPSVPARFRSAAGARWRCISVPSRGGRAAALRSRCFAVAGSIAAPTSPRSCPLPRKHGARCGCGCGASVGSSIPIHSSTGAADTPQWTARNTAPAGPSVPRHPRWSGPPETIEGMELEELEELSSGMQALDRRRSSILPVAVAWGLALGLARRIVLSERIASDIPRDRRKSMEHSASAGRLWLPHREACGGGGGGGRTERTVECDAVPVDAERVLGRASRGGACSVHELRTARLGSPPEGG